MDRSKYLETQEQKKDRLNRSCLVFHGDGICKCNNQPERSKREDSVSKKDILMSKYILGQIDYEEMKQRCGTLNSMET